MIMMNDDDDDDDDDDTMIIIIVCIFTLLMTICYFWAEETISQMKQMICEFSENTTVQQYCSICFSTKYTSIKKSIKV